MYEVVYFSRGGNTQRLAAAIASELHVKPLHVRWVKELPEGADIFLGSGLYFMRPARMVRDFIRNNDFSGKRIALFGTSTSGISVETLWMDWLLKRKGATIIGKYHCAGKFTWRIGKRRLCFRGKRPSENDFAEARQFAQSIRTTLQAGPLTRDSQSAATTASVAAHS